MSKTISIIKVSKEYGEKPFLENVSLKLAERERLCIVGENGAGKSTLLKMIAGTVEPTSGSIVKSPGTRCHYVPQEFVTPEGQTIEGFLKDNADHAHFAKIFATGKALGYDIEKNLNKECNALSGGQQKILALSVGIALSPDFLLLDEPENHLDIVSRLELVKLLANYRGGVLFVSHDRLMVDSIADKVAEVAAGAVHVSEGGYQDYIDARLSRIGGMQRSYDAESNRIRQLEKSIVILRQKAFRGKDVSQYKKHQAELDELKDKHADTARPDDTKTKVNINQRGDALHGGKLLCRVTDATFKYSGHSKPIFKDVSLEMRTGSHIVLLGRNGAGKSSFLKCLNGTLALSAGTVAWAEGITYAYFDQHAEFDDAMTPLQIVTKELACDNERGYAALGAMKFNRERMEIPIATLSGGERMRVRFAIVFGAKPSFMLLDEPTNHLDEVTWQILMDAVNNSPSTILLVTHDYEFIEGLNHKTFWLMHDRTIAERHKTLSELVDEIK